MDLIQREGNYPLPPQAPSTLGVEFSGTIESFGADAEKGFKIGDEVFGLAYGGAYAEYIAVSTHMLIHKPSHMSWEEAAGIPETWITATQALYLIGGFEPGKRVLWHAGASSVSISGQQLCKGDGAAAGGFDAAGWRRSEQYQLGFLRWRGSRGAQWRVLPGAWIRRAGRDGDDGSRAHADLADEAGTGGMGRDFWSHWKPVVSYGRRDVRAVGGRS